MTKILLSTTMLAGLLIAGAAQAADMPLKAPPRAAPYYTDWTGFYVFGFGGYSWGKISPDDFNFSGIAQPSTIQSPRAAYSALVLATLAVRRLGRRP